jgi:hypothetical protein
LDFRGLGLGVYRLFEDDRANLKKEIFEQLRRIRAFSYDVLANDKSRQVQLPYMYAAWAERLNLLEETPADVEIAPTKKHKQPVE